MKARFVTKDGQVTLYDVKSVAGNGVLTAYIPKEDVSSDIEYIDFMYDY